MVRPFPLVLGLSFLFFSPPVNAKAPKLISHLGQDSVQSFTRWPLLFIVGGGITAGVLTQKDQSLQDPFRRGRNLGKADTVFRILGESYVVDTSALITYCLGKISRDEEVALTGETLLEGLFLTEVVTGATKLAFRRERPDGGNFGFPSGHTSRTFALATILETLHGPAAGIPAYLMAGAISFSRIDENAHNISDVVFGACLGTAIGLGTAHFHKKTTPLLTILPLPTPGGFGFLASRTF